MNFDIKKQCDKPLRYTDHAIERAEERNVPIPKYIPLNAVCIGKQNDNDTLAFKLEYSYIGIKYTMVVSEDMVVFTVYPPEKETIVDYVKMITNQTYAIKQKQRNMRQNMTQEYYTHKQGKYKHMEFEAEYDTYYQCA
jgi:hypothetical protein